MESVIWNGADFAESTDTMIRFSPNPNRSRLIPWREWSAEAFHAALEQDKPVMLFLSAFWCRYCQRMDEEAFSETENIALLNAYFISLRVENGQRPDIDSRYNYNGWPTIAFMSPDGHLLGAVNYLSADQFKEALIDIYMSYQQRKGEIHSAAKIDEVPSKSLPPQMGEQRFAASLSEITKTIMALADPINGGYGDGQKFIHAEANEFLLAAYEMTHDTALLDHVCLTLERMRRGEIYDHEADGFFRTSSGADWSHPHREKLLNEQAGLLANCLHAFALTQRADFARTAEEIIGYLNRKLWDPVTGAFFGCEDFLRRDTSSQTSSGELFSIIDNCIYSDANALTIEAYLTAATILGEAGYKEQALIALEFVWQNCRYSDGGMCHFFDGSAQVPGLLQDQARFGAALVRAYSASGDGRYLARARELAQFVLTKLKNPAGGYYDICEQDLVGLRSRLTLIESNGSAASFFLQLAEASGEASYREAALWALAGFTGDVSSYGIHAAPFGQALAEYLRRR
jgi:uncharacterized protein YyaL (SSP411 family)